MTNKELIEKLNQVKDLSAGGQPEAVWIASNRDILMSQIQPSSVNESPVKELGNGFYYGQYFSNLLRQNFFKPAIATFSIVLVMLGYSATIGVANASLPGDIFYPIKTTKERVQLAFTFQEAEQVKLQMTFVTNRATELQQLVRATDNDSKKTEAVKKTAQKITKDIGDVKDHLNKINIASFNNDKSKIIEVAKEVDTKTLEVKQGLVETHSILSSEAKKNVEIDLKKAISTTEETGATALNVIIDKYKSGEASIDSNEVASRVAERIKDAEGNIIDANKVIETVSTSTTAIINSSAKLSNPTSTSTIPTLSSIKDQPQAAQVVITEAKNLLDQKDFSSALEKVTETNKIVSTVEENVRVVVDESNKISNTSTSTSQSL